MRSPKHFTCSIPARIVRKVCPPRMIDWYALYALIWRPRRTKSLAKISPGVATPCPAAPPIATVKVRSILVSFVNQKLSPIRWTLVCAELHNEEKQPRGHQADFRLLTTRATRPPAI